MATPPPPSSGPVSIPGLDVFEPIGHGGFSVVYRARQHSLNREVAVKVINTGFATEVEARRFERECHALGRLSRHPNIVTVFADAMTTDGRPAIVMELYESTLRDRLNESGPLDPREVLSIGVRVCGALAEAHAAGVLHRDLKPHNIFVSVYGEPALGDFGISTIDSEKSQSGFGAMSVAYAAPETIDDGTVDARSDIYSLGATLYQLASGEAPFASSEMGQAIRRILTEPPAPIVREGVPGELSDLLLRVLSKHPGDRPPTALAFAEELRGLQRQLGFDSTPIPRSTAPRPSGDTRDADDSTTDHPLAAPGAPSTAGAAAASASSSPRPFAAPGAAGGASTPPPPPGSSQPPSDQPGGSGGGGMPSFPAPVPTDMTVAREGPMAGGTGGPPPDEPPAGSGSGGNRRWLVVGLIALIVIAGGVVLALTIGGGDDSGDAASSSTAPAVETTTGPAPTEPEPEPATTTTSPPTTLPPTTTRPPKKTTTTTTTTTTLPPTPDFMVGECVFVDDQRSGKFDVQPGSCGDSNGPYRIVQIVDWTGSTRCRGAPAFSRDEFEYCLELNVVVGFCYNFRDAGGGMLEDAYVFGSECIPGSGEKQVYAIYPGTHDGDACGGEYADPYVYYWYDHPVEVVCTRPV